MKNNIQSLVKIVWEMKLKIFLDEFTSKQVQASKIFLGTPALLILEMNCFNKNTKSNFSPERLDYFSLAKSAQHEVQRNKIMYKQTEYQNLKVSDHT